MDEKPISLPPWLPWATTACLAAMAACLGELWIIERMRVRLMGDEAALARASLLSAQNQLQAERIVSRREVADLEARASGILSPLSVAASTDGRKAGAEAPAGAVVAGPCLLCDRVPRSADGGGYQLWAILNDGRAVELASFEGTGGPQRVRLRPDAQARSIRNYVLSRRPKGVSPTLEDAKAQGLIILASASDPQRK